MKLLNRAGDRETILVLIQKVHFMPLVIASVIFRNFFVGLPGVFCEKNSSCFTSIEEIFMFLSRS